MPPYRTTAVTLIGGTTRTYRTAAFACRAKLAVRRCGVDRLREGAVVSIGSTRGRSAGPLPAPASASTAPGRFHCFDSSVHRDRLRRSDALLFATEACHTPGKCVSREREGRAKEYRADDVGGKDLQRGAETRVCAPLLEEQGPHPVGRVLERQHVGHGAQDLGQVLHRRSPARGRQPQADDEQEKRDEERGGGEGERNRNSSKTPASRCSP